MRPLSGLAFIWSGAMTWLLASTAIFPAAPVHSAESGLNEFLRAQNAELVDTAKATPPKSPYVWRMEALPKDDPRVGSYKKELGEFLARARNRSRLTEIFRSDALTTAFKASASNADKQNLDYVAARISEWNGPIFWAPASKDTDENLRAGDEARAVLGPIPPFDVTRLGKFTLPDGSTIETAELALEVDGNQVRLKPNPSKPGSPLEFEHRDLAGQVVKWTPTVEKCDKPSLAGGVTPCGTASRISRIVRGNVEWIALARKSRRVEVLTADPFWAHENSSFALIGYIGFNRQSGEVAFFDGAGDKSPFNWTATIVQPGGKGYQDAAGRAVAAGMYDTSFAVNCAACHNNMEPRIITPYIKQARVGYSNPKLAGAFSLGDLLPEKTRNDRTPYRVVGTGFNLVNAVEIQQAMTITDPTRNCTSCHTLANQQTARFASDSVGKLGTLTGDAGIENSYRTEWASLSGAGKIHPWMLPGPLGNDIGSEPNHQVLSDADWQMLKQVLENPLSDKRSRRVYTLAPAPESSASDDTRLADPAGSRDLKMEILPGVDGASPYSRKMQISWKYLNTLGGVPERDDVRFHIAIREMAASGTAPVDADYPTITQAKGDEGTLLREGIYTDQGLLILKDVSFAGHLKWTDPSATLTPRDYRIAVPAAPGRRYLIRIVAKRHTFDGSREAYSDANHTAYLDVK
jgi:hypothetical protein